jgi:hypothetical protein
MKTKEIVTSFYNDGHKLHWIHQITDCKKTIYQKNDKLKRGESFINNSYVNIPNYGRCDYAFLWHIINNYNNLSDITIFTKINWQDNHLDFNKLLDKSNVYDYCEVGDHPEFHVWIDKQSTKIDEHYYVKNRCVNDVSNIEKDKIHIFEADRTPDYFKHIFKNSTLPRSQILWGHGPCFAVSKELIQLHPVTIYEWMLNRFYIETQSWNNDLAKDLWKNKYPEDTLQKEILSDIGHHYHNTFLRFWRILFTHNIDESKYKIESN